MESKLVRGGGKKQRGWQIIIAPSLKKSKGKKQTIHHYVTLLKHHPSISNRNGSSPDIRP
jgi:hypothetical protein